MNKMLEQYKQQLAEAQKNNGDWETPYKAVMKSLYEQDVLFVALSKQDFNFDNNSSTPLISTKDFGGIPALYIFSDVSIASMWMRHYRHVTEDMRYGLVGAIEKKNHNFLSVFQIAAAVGAKMIMLDEGGDYVGIGMDSFLEVNGINSGDIEIPISKEEAERMIANNEAPKIQFSAVAAIPLTRNDASE